MLRREGKGGLKTSVLVKEKGLSAQSENYSGASYNDVRHNIPKIHESSGDVFAFLLFLIVHEF